jgi:hypothetical protein
VGAPNSNKDPKVTFIEEYFGFDALHFLFGYTEYRLWKN